MLVVVVLVVTVLVEMNDANEANWTMVKKAKRKREGLDEFGELILGVKLVDLIHSSWANDFDDGDAVADGI